MIRGCEIIPKSVGLTGLPSRNQECMCVLKIHQRGRWRESYSIHLFSVTSPLFPILPLLPSSTSSTSSPSFPPPSPSSLLPLPSSMAIMDENEYTRVDIFYNGYARAGQCKFSTPIIGMLQHAHKMAPIFGTTRARYFFDSLFLSMVCSLYKYSTLFL